MCVFFDVINGIHAFSTRARIINKVYLPQRLINALMRRNRQKKRTTVMSSSH